MKKAFLVVVAFLCFGISTGYAQKYGHVNAQEVMASMPGFDTLQTAMESYYNDLQTEYNYKLADLQAKYEKYDKESATLSSTIKAMREKEIQDLQTNLAMFKENLETFLQEKQVELVQPFQEKVLKAIEDVAKENGFAYIFDNQVLLYSDGGEDVSALVKKKLGIK